MLDYVTDIEKSLKPKQHNQETDFQDILEICSCVVFT